MEHIVCSTDRGRGLYDLTALVEQRIPQNFTGLCHLFIRHTSASLLITENADPDVHADLERLIADLVVDGDPRFQHSAEGDDDMPAHIRSALTHTDLTIPVRQGRLELGTWQGIYLWEHRFRAHRREVVCTLIAATAGSATG